MIRGFMKTGVETHEVEVRYGDGYYAYGKCWVLLQRLCLFRLIFILILSLLIC